MKFLFILQYDSFIKTLIPVINQLKMKQIACDIILYKKFLKTNWINDSIISLLDNNNYQIAYLNKILKKLDDEFDLIVIGSVGGSFINKIVSYIKDNNLKTKIATGYVGLLLNNNPIGFEKGIERRFKTDYIWSPGELFTKKILQSNYNNAKTIVESTGLPRFDDLYKKSKLFKKQPKKIILFLEQPTFPKTKKERILLVHKLNYIAKNMPEYNLIIKPRFSQKIGHAHRLKFPLSDIVLSIKNLSSNLLVSNKDLIALYSRTKFAITISSTAGIETMLIGIPTYFINDFCDDKNIYGSSDFVDFNTVINSKKIPEMTLPKINYNLAQSFLRFDGNNTKRLVQGLINITNS